MNAKGLPSNLHLILQHKTRRCGLSMPLPRGFLYSWTLQELVPHTSQYHQPFSQLENALLFSTTKRNQEAGNFSLSLKSVTQIHLQTLGTVLQSAPAFHLLFLWLSQAVGISSSHQAVTVLRISDGSSPSNRLFQVTCPYKQTTGKKLHRALTFVLARHFFDEIHSNLPDLSTPDKGRLQTHCYTNGTEENGGLFCFSFWCVCLSYPRNPAKDLTCIIFLLSA